MLPNKPKSWLSGGLWKPKNPHSLEHLKYLHSVLCKHQTVTEQNRALLVETLRSMSEILIWGDQNDSSVFDFFLEKNMLAFFLRFMKQKSGRHLCVQLLQTLNILFDNISNETSVYYLLSNNHINSIIVHKFDFSDEEVMAYYISFLKTLSLKLNKHTIHFYFNEHTNDFALYTEGIKFFNHPEAMVRIAVRTITLNVYKVDDKSMLRYIRDKTAAPYFTNLVWFIGNHVLKLDSCVRHDIDHNSRDRLSDLVAEHLDHLHYINDIISLDIDALNQVLTDHLLNRLFIPLYVYPLTKRQKYQIAEDDRPHVSSVVALFLLSQVFLILSHAPLVRRLADIIFNSDTSVCKMPSKHALQLMAGLEGGRICGFVKPVEPLAETLDNNRGGGKPVRRPNYSDDDTLDEDHISSTYYDAEEEPEDQSEDGEIESDSRPEVQGAATSTEPNKSVVEESLPTDTAVDVENCTDEEKLLLSSAVQSEDQQEFSLNNRPFLEAVFNTLECSENDYEALFALCLLYALGHNKGINQELLDTIQITTERSVSKELYNVLLVEKLIQIISISCQNSSPVRLATLEMSLLLLRTLAYRDTGHCYLQDRHLAALEGAREEATLLLRNFYKSEEIFLDMFEDEYREMKSKPLNVEYLTMDSSILLPPTGTPLTGIHFKKRLPCGEVERARRAIRVFFHLREVSLMLRQEPERQLPLTKQEECVVNGDVLDLNNSDLIACTVIGKDSRRERRFLVIDVLQLILVEPDSRRLGWGIVRFVGFLQDVEVTGDKDDSRSLHITIHKPCMNTHGRPLPLLNARFVFDDHIRCMAAKQRLSKGRLKARQRKMQMIARLLELPAHIVDSMYHPPSHSQSAVTLRTSHATSLPQNIPGRSHPRHVQSTTKSGSKPTSGQVARQLERAQALTAKRQSAAARSGGRLTQRPGGATRMVQKSTDAAPSGDVEQAEEVLAECDASTKKAASSASIMRGKKPDTITGKSRARSLSHSPQRTQSDSAHIHKTKSDRQDQSDLSELDQQRVVTGAESDSVDCAVGHDEATRSSVCAGEVSQQRRVSGSNKDISLSHSPPKSLIPAQEPRMSLVMSCDNPANTVTRGLDSPKLVPPAEPERFRSHSDPLNTSSTEVKQQEMSTTRPPLRQISLKEEATVAENTTVADLSRVESPSCEVDSTIDQSNLTQTQETMQKNNEKANVDSLESNNETAPENLSL